MQAEDIQILFSYNYWANERIFRAAEHLSDEQFVAPARFGYGNSLCDILVHTMGAEWMWRKRCQKNISPPALPRADAFPTLASLRIHWHEEEQQMRAFLDTLRDEDMHYLVHYTNTRGAAFTTPLWQALVQVVNHGTQHRSEAALLLTSYGHSPGDIDFIVFLRQEQRAQEHSR
jgi:uncharacterized damage-inducible protein DinB